MKADACGRPFKVNDFLHLENQADSKAYQVQLKREVRSVRMNTLVITGVWTIRLLHCTADAGESRGAEAHSPGNGSDFSDRYSQNTAGSGEIPSENGSIGGPSLKRQLTDPARGADEKRLRRESTSSVDNDSNRPGTEVSKLDSVASTASIGDS